MTIQNCIFGVELLYLSLPLIFTLSISPFIIYKYIENIKTMAMDKFNCLDSQKDVSKMSCVWMLKERSVEEN